MLFSYIIPLCIRRHDMALKVLGRHGACGGNIETQEGGALLLGEKSVID